MEIEALIKKMKDINPALIDFIEADEDCDAKFKTLIQIIEKQEIFQKKEELQLLFQLISIIADNHYRSSDFFDKLEKIFQYLIKDTPSPISYFIPDYTNYNKRILFHLLEKGFIKSDDTFLKKYLQSKPTNKDLYKYQSYYYYLYPVMKANLDEKIQKEIEKEINVLFDVDDILTFTKKCQIGENDSYICSLIRSDLVEEFVTYTSQASFSLSTKISPTIYETHLFLIDKEPTLIEYASFFGSTKIIQYLKYNNIQLTPSLWSYGVHSNNAELIHFLEGNVPKSETKKIYDEAVIESIKCHHNGILNYIKDNFYETTDDNEFYENFSDTISNSLNFSLIPIEIESIICNPKKAKGFKLYQLCFTLTTITIPSSVTTIGEYAFYKRSSLTSITIPSSVTTIGDGAFYKCSSLLQITIPSSVTTIGDGAFYECSSLTQITIPSSVKMIGKNVFSGCSSLTQIEIPSSVTMTGKDVFSGSSSLTRTTVINNDEDIYFEELALIEELNNIVDLEDDSTVYIADLPMNQFTYPPSCLIDEDFIRTLFQDFDFYHDSVIIKTKIGRNGSPYSFAYIKFTSREEALKAVDEMNYIRLDYVPIRLIMIDEEGKNNIFNSDKNCIIFKYSDRSIEALQVHVAFSHFGKVISVKMPLDIVGKGSGKQCSSRGYSFVCFHNQESIKQAKIESEGVTINNLPFDIIPVSSKIDGINYEGFFEGCSSLSQMTIPSFVTLIENYAFSRCSSLTQISIPSSVTSIGRFAFNECSSLKQITIPSSVTSICESAFYKCTSLIQITIPSSVTSIGKSAFNKCISLTQVTIPSSVTSIGDYLFYKCSSLAQVTIPSSVTSIGDYLFFDCASLAQITIPSSVTSIGSYAFSRCSSLTQITIPSSVTCIGYNAFLNCAKLEQMTIPSSLDIEGIGLDQQIQILKI